MSGGGTSSETGVRLLHARNGVMIRPSERSEAAPGAAVIALQDDLALFSWIPAQGMAMADTTAINRADALANSSRTSPGGGPLSSSTSSSSIFLSHGALHPAISFPLFDLRLFSFQLPEHSPYVGLSLYVGEDAASSSAALPILWILARKGEPKERVVDLITAWFREAGLNLLRIATAQHPTFTVLPSTSPLAGGDYAPPKAKYQRPAGPPPARSEAENASLALLRAHHEAQHGGLHAPTGAPPPATSKAETATTAGATSSTPSSAAAATTASISVTPVSPAVNPEAGRAVSPQPEASSSSTSPAVATSRGHKKEPSTGGIGKFMDDIQFGILERFARITRTTQNKAVDFLESNPTARQAVGLLPQEYVAKVLPAEEAAKIAEDFEPARNYISTFAEDMLKGKKGARRRVGTGTSFDAQMEDLPAEESELGDFEVVEFDDLPLEWRNHHRTGMPITPESFLSWFDKQGKLEKQEGKVREHVFYSGVEMDIRPSVWPFLLGVYKFDSTEAERLAIRNKNEEEYLELKRKWKELLASPPTAEGSPLLGGPEVPSVAIAPPTDSAASVLKDLKSELASPGLHRTVTAGDEAEGQDVVSALRERRYRIEKDVVRTDRNIPFFAGDRDSSSVAGDSSDADIPSELEEDEAPPNIPGVSVAGWNSNLAILRDILVTYSFKEFSLGYVQGMSDLLAPVLAVIRDEVDSFWCFVGFMEMVKANFARDQVGMRTQLLDLERLVKFLDPKLHNHLERIDGLNFFFCFRWLLIWFKREFDFTDIMRLWEVLWSNHLTKHFHLFFAVAILQWKREELLACRAFDELLKCVNELNGQIPVEETLELAEQLFFKFQWKLAKWKQDPDSVHLPFDAEGNSELAAREKAKLEARSGTSSSSAKAATAADSGFTLPKLDGAVLDTKTLTQCGLSWRKANNWILPDGAIESGGEYMDSGRKKGRQLFICRAQHKKGMYPGKGPLGSYLLGGCNFSAGGRELTSTAYDVLCLSDELRQAALSKAGAGADPVQAIRDFAMHKVLDWVPCQGTLVDTQGCISAGCQTNEGELLYVARCFYKDGLHVGWIRENDPRGVSIGWGGQEVRCDEYEVLKVQLPPPEPEPEGKLVEEKLVDLEDKVGGKPKALRVDTTGGSGSEEGNKTHWVTTLEKLIVEK